MATHLKIVILTCLLSPMVLMEEMNPVMLEQRARGRLGQRTSRLEKRMEEQEKRTGMLEETIRMQEETIRMQEEMIRALEECKPCLKIQELNETVSEMQETINPNPADVPSCEEALMRAGQTLPDAEYLIRNGNLSFPVYCDMTSDGEGWALIARFSNKDNKNWMRDDGYWWYDQQVAIGTTTAPSINADMISSAFWLVSGREFKITRSDDPSHTPLLQTTGNCLAGQTFRSKITSYGDFRNGKVWASNKCLGSCTVQYGGQYKSTDGFQQAECSGNIQSANKIGFWCDWSYDGSVMMIGGGGSACSRADHGIGITETDEASFVAQYGIDNVHDFGYDASTGKAPSQSYSLNLWIR